MTLSEINYANHDTEPAGVNASGQRLLAGAVIGSPTTSAVCGGVNFNTFGSIG
ncbi:uncharacterized protein METZ01_LOCUS446627 [marine metagenome]|uniref:Uncharacterized protein n=1 Tax=marine metagenome TaxID=408172 RepID=A0A382ZED9_9ZZZZ